VSWTIDYVVRPADPMDRRDHPDAAEVRMMNGDKPIRVVGVWETTEDAATVADFLNDAAQAQIR
jgi:hypothetical protein